MKRTMFILATTMTATWVTQASAGSLSQEQLVQLQADMQSHIEATSIDGAVVAFDTEHAEVRNYYPAKAHPKIMTMGDNFIMCADMVDATGNAIMANFYMARQGDHYIVFHTTFGEDPALTRMMADGRLAMAN